MKKTTLLFIAFLFFALAFFFLRPVPNLTVENSITENAVVSDIYEGGIKDAVFEVANSDRKFYINRGLENGLDLDVLKEKLIGQEVIFKYPDYWTPLDWNKSHRHVSVLMQDDVVIYDEAKYYATKK